MNIWISIAAVSIIFNDNPVFPIQDVQEICTRLSPNILDSPENNKIPDNKIGVLFAQTRVRFP
jgi:hypothetical protein